jgi:hypothetical protein
MAPDDGQSTVTNARVDRSAIALVIIPFCDDWTSGVVADARHPV